MLAHQRETDRKPKPRPLANWFGRHEWLENALRLALRKPGPVVLDRRKHRPVIRPRPHDEPRIRAIRKRAPETTIEILTPDFLKSAPGALETAGGDIGKAEDIKGSIDQNTQLQVQAGLTINELIGVMNGGRLEQWADAYTLYHRPATRFVARFIGHGVFTPAEIVACAHGPCVHTPFGELDDPAECPLPEAYPGGQCDLLLRADDVVHDDASPVKARIERKAFRGSEFLYTLRLAGGEQVLAHVPSHHDHAVGEWIGIRPAVDHVVTFPREPAAAAPLPRDGH